ncbi:hypothetical protein [Polynucleobacter sp. UB-Raua-W9]|uniref:hypothetical protein n=1 Tax=Polynucleobacter sp. UB-Raua-W9 TaxID=1819736 RepID=UPI001BFE2881|nr:hypothetical protein [Polynucleobacter sp. UB-Raua-W9]QWD71586.1 hypothetical protein AOC07_04795 [Polynucleobacter sp. UB-Raua-W9]
MKPIKLAMIGLLGLGIFGCSQMPPQQSFNQPPESGQGRVLATSSDATGTVSLYSGSCRLSQHRNNYPYYWEARTPNGAIGKGNDGTPLVGCYVMNANTNQVLLMAGTASNPYPLPLSSFVAPGQSSGGGFLGFLQSLGGGITRAANYYNNSAAQTQGSTTNLTPGLTGGNGMNCTPDGRGGYNCR